VSTRKQGLLLTASPTTAPPRRAADDDDTDINISLRTHSDLHHRFHLDFSDFSWTTTSLDATNLTYYETTRDRGSRIQI
jgi:hypothetical protein